MTSGKHFIGEDSLSLESKLESESPIAEGFICLTCREVFKTADEAMKCAMGHEDLMFLPKFEIGKELPYAVEIRKRRAGRVVWSEIFELVPLGNKPPAEIEVQEASQNNPEDTKSSF